MFSSLLITHYFALGTWHFALDTCCVAKKKRPKAFTAVTAVKSMSREQIGAVPPTRRVENVKKKRPVTKPKHKPTTQQLLSDDQ